MSIQRDQDFKKIKYITLFKFFIPLGVSASLVTISHVIINSTLARSPNPVVVIASYSLAMSLFAIFERCAVILRQTSATLVRDQHSFKLVSRLAISLLATLFLLSLIMGYSSIGELFFLRILGVKENMLGPTMTAYRVLMFVTIFSGIRCLFQGVIISNLRTKWLTIGMVFRLLIMGFLSWLVLRNGWVNHGYIGAYIFLAGMAIEALVSTIEGRHIIKELPAKKTGHHVKHRSNVMRFYLPLLLASLLAISISPAINAVLGWSGKAEIAIASYAVAFSVMNLLVSFTSYIHQIVINFYKQDAQTVIRFTLFFSLLPGLLLMGMAYSPVGVWGFEHIMGVSGELLDQSLIALKFFVIFALCFPWLDFINGVLMLKGQTKVMSFSQTGNVVITFIALITLFFLLPNGGGVIGSLAQSIGVVAETVIALFFLNLYSDNPRGMKFLFLRKKHKQLG